MKQKALILALLAMTSAVYSNAQGKKATLKLTAVSDAANADFGISKVAVIDPSNLNIVSAEKMNQKAVPLRDKKIDKEKVQAVINRQEIYSSKVSVSK